MAYCGHSQDSVTYVFNICILRGCANSTLLSLFLFKGLFFLFEMIVINYRSTENLRMYAWHFVPIENKLMQHLLDLFTL